ncbi:hypothetical protein RMCBS344292_17911 [Rhizopus microsporus]|nr:hypothetical protein RMCBS344292_17911 [Rhizopus microsporus]
MHILSPQSYSSGSSCLDTLFDVSYHNKCTSFSNSEYIYSDNQPMNSNASLVPSIEHLLCDFQASNDYYYRKRPGPPPKAYTRRAEQNRAAQKAFRERKQKYVKELEEKVMFMEQLKIELEHLREENIKIKAYATKLEQQLEEKTMITLGTPPQTKHSIERTKSNQKRPKKAPKQKIQASDLLPIPLYTPDKAVMLASSSSSTGEQSPATNWIDSLFMNSMRPSSPSIQVM